MSSKFGNNAADYLHYRSIARLPRAVALRLCAARAPICGRTRRKRAWPGNDAEKWNGKRHATRGRIRPLKEIDR